MKSVLLWRIRVFGIVQGVGFRPTVSRHAIACGIKGSVSNVGPYVEIWAKGLSKDLEAFRDLIEHHPPKRAVILKLTVEEKDPGSLDFTEFSIIESEKRQGDIFVSPDIAVCPQCKEEMYDPGDRRYLHPFINCTCCGPRLTILDSMPYDRVRTSMAEFPMCEECEYEYTHPKTRRYDAQPVCCNECGPQVYLLDRDVRGADAIREVRKKIRDGGIVAIKGIGGFHLCCDATSKEAVSLLRKRKNRPVKPFAIMMKDLNTVSRECELTPAKEQILDGHQKPILLLPRKEGGHVADAAAPGNPSLGVMLPYAPIHLLLFDSRDDIQVPDCLVMTSANTQGAPICRDDEDARRELFPLCDLILSHDRKIRLRADDTVMDFFEDEPYMIRRSRGYAPLPVMSGEELSGQVLAIGGELKNTFCIAKNQLYYLSPYIGDMGDVRTVYALKESVKRMEELLEAEPVVAACDLHPGYNTTAVAEDMGLPLCRVQHHYAHILSCMAENDYRDAVIGVAFDGTGYGTDGTIWGGELLLADYDGFTRLGSVTPFLHVGGDLASKEGWRIAVSLIYRLYGRQRGSKIIQELGLCQEKEAGVIMAMADHRINAIESTSLGRIFDAVSAILGICKNNTFEGEASVFLQFAAQAYENEEKSSHQTEVKLEPEKFLTFPEEEQKEGDDRIVHLRTDLIVREIIEKKLKGWDKGKLAFLFHHKLARAVALACIHLEDRTKVHTVALSGGVWQNQLLLRLTAGMLKKAGLSVLTHHLVPPNDGGICLGQAAKAMHELQKNSYKKIGGYE